VFIRSFSYCTAISGGQINDDDPLLQDVADPGVVSGTVEAWRPVIINKMDTAYEIGSRGQVKLYDGKLFVLICLLMIYSVGVILNILGEISYGGSDNGGKYRRVSIHLNGQIHRGYVHSLVFNAFYPTQYNRATVVNHRDGDGNNSWLRNLNGAAVNGDMKHCHLFKEWRGESEGGDIQDFVDLYSDLVK